MLKSKDRTKYIQFLLHRLLYIIHLYKRRLSCTIKYIIYYFHYQSKCSSFHWLRLVSTLTSFLHGEQFFLYITTAEFCCQQTVKYLCTWVGRGCSISQRCRGRKPVSASNWCTGNRCLCESAGSMTPAPLKRTAESPEFQIKLKIRETQLDHLNSGMHNHGLHNMYKKLCSCYHLSKF